MFGKLPEPGMFFYGSKSPEFKPRPGSLSNVIRFGLNQGLMHYPTTKEGMQDGKIFYPDGKA
jgi:hypothetical protein